MKKSLSLNIPIYAIFLQILVAHMFLGQFDLHNPTANTHIFVMAMFVLVIFLGDVLYNRISTDWQKTSKKNEILLYFLNLMGAFIKPKRFEIPRFTPTQVKALLSLIIFSAGVEFVYFGVPLISGVSYNEFGFPILHHAALMGWLLVFFSPKHKLKFLIFHSFLCLLMLNRQYILFSVLAFLFSYEGKKQSSLLISTLFFAVILAMGIVRNTILGVEFNPLESFIDVPLLSYFDFVIFFIIGPYIATFGSSSAEFNDLIFLFWNTIPEWRLLTLTTFKSISLSFILFYLLSTYILNFGARIINFNWSRYVLAISFVFIFFTFFSRTLFTTNFISCLLVVSCLDLIDRVNWSKLRS